MIKLSCMSNLLYFFIYSKIKLIYKYFIFLGLIEVFIEFIEGADDENK